MVTLTTDQPTIHDPSYLVKIGGDYNDNDLVVIYKKNEPSQEVAFFALFIATGVNP